MVGDVALGARAPVAPSIVNGGGKHPKAVNKESVQAAGDFQNPAPTRRRRPAVVRATGRAPRPTRWPRCGA
jgi:hypothetical protein